MSASGSARLRASTRLPELVRAYAERSIPAGEVPPALVRVTQAGEMWQRPGARPLRFEAIEDFTVDRVAFAWRARFPIVGPLALEVVDDFADGKGSLQVRLLGVPLRTQSGPETAVGQALRYLAELPWAPQAIAANRTIEWRELDERSVELATRVGPTRAVVQWSFDDTGAVVSATGIRPFRVGGSFVPRRWGGDFGDYASFDGLRVPGSAEVWWELPEGRFVYWRGRVTAVELLGTEQ